MKSEGGSVYCITDRMNRNAEVLINLFNLRFPVALQIVGLELEGKHHRALADARNIARLLPWALG